MERGTVLIYEGEIVELCSREKVSLHVTVRNEMVVADILAETTGGYRFVDFLRERFGEPAEGPHSIFHGEFGDGVPALPVSVWWRVERDEAIAIIDDLMHREG